MDRRVNASTDLFKMPRVAELCAKSPILSFWPANSPPPSFTNTPTNLLFRSSGTNAYTRSLSLFPTPSFLSLFPTPSFPNERRPTISMAGVSSLAGCMNPQCQWNGSCGYFFTATADARELPQAAGALCLCGCPGAQHVRWQEVSFAFLTGVLHLTTFFFWRHELRHLSRCKARLQRQER